MTDRQRQTAASIPIALIADVLDLAGTIFADGFESGDLDEWAAVVQ